MNRISVYLHILKMGFVELLAFRVTIIMLALSIPITLFARYYLLAALYDDGTTVIDGYNIRELLTYLACAWLLRSFFRSGTDRRLGRQVRSGDIVFELMRPVDFMWLTLFKAMGKSLNRFVFISLPLIVIFLLGDILILSSDPVRWLYFFALVGIGYVIAFEMQFLMGLMAFFIGYNISIIWTVDLVLQILSGLLLPLHFFPEQISKLLMAMPFRHIFYTPAQVFVGHAKLNEIPGFLLSALMWAVVLGIINYLVYKRAEQKLSIAGG